HGAWLGFLDAGDVLRPDALFEMVYYLNRHADVDLLYSDEETMGSPGVPAAPHFKANISMSCSCEESAYGRLSLIRTGMDSSPRKIGHVPKVLCSSRHLPSPQRSTLDEQPVVVMHAPCPLMDLEAVRSILVVKLDHLGDVLLTIPAMRRLR